MDSLVSYVRRLEVMEAYKQDVVVANKQKETATVLQHTPSKKMAFDWLKNHNTGMKGNKDGK